MPARTTLSRVLDEATRHTPGPPAEVLDWSEVAARSQDMYADELRARFLIGPEVHLLTFEPLVARIAAVIPRESPVERYHHASLIAQRVMEARR